MKRAAIYARVSTEDQSDSGYGLPGQIEECRAYADRLGASIVAEFQEDVSGAKSVVDRTQGARLFEMVRRHELDSIIVHRVDRLSRDIVDLLITVRSWLKAGIEIHAGDVGKIESDNDITLLIKGWQGTDERKKIRERSMLGKRMKAKSGKVIGNRPPYGYRHLKDEKGKVVNFEIFDAEAEIVRLIYHWYNSGDEYGCRMSAFAIARRLSEMGIPTPGERGPGYKRVRASGFWQVDKVVKILGSETYAGIWRFGVKIGKTRIQRPKEEWIEVAVPAIIDRAMWEKTQQQKQRNKKFAKRNAKHDYLLSGLIRCNCGMAISGNFLRNKRYYRCGSTSNHYWSLENFPCHQRSIRADAIEADIWESIVGLFQDGPRLEELLYIAQQEEINTMDPKREELQAIEGMIVSVEYEAGEIGQALRIAKGIIAKSLEHNMEDVNKRYDALCKRRDELQNDLSQTRLTDAAIQDTLLFAEDVHRGIQNANFDDKRRTLETFQVTVTIRDREFVVTSMAGEWNGKIRRLTHDRSANTEDEKAVIVNDAYTGNTSLPAPPIFSIVLPPPG